MKRKLGTRIISMILVVMMVVTMLPMSIFTASAATNHSQEEAVKWAISQIGRSIDYDGIWNAQCVDLIKAYYAYLGVKPTTGNGCDYSWNALPNGWQRIKYYSGFVPQPGDIAVWTYANSNYGHVAIITSADAWGMNVVDQGATYGYKTKNSRFSYAYGAFYGVIRPNFLTIKPEAPLATTPNLLLSSTDIAVDNSIKVNWSSQNASKYDLEITYPSGKITTEKNIESNSKTLILSEIGKYSFRVMAYNSENKATSWSNYIDAQVHNKVTVNFIDWDGTPLGSQTVDYGKSATAPASPPRKGYVFQGWDGSFYNVTSDVTVRATYKPIVYTVRFFDKNGKIIGEPQKVDYGKDAVAPQNPNTPENYKFLGWSSEDYKNVYTDKADKTIDINGIYAWYNSDLPVVCSDVRAIRQKDGYYVYFNLTNYDEAVTRGRAVVSLKTASGKLVDMTESAAFSLPIDKTSANKKPMEVFIPCDFAASSVEVDIVKDYATGIPISPKVTAKVENGLGWSEWTGEKPAGEYESRTEYRYRDKKTTTGNTKTMDGWTYTGTRNEKVIKNWADDWSWNYIGAYDNESSRREVQTRQAIYSYNYKTVYNYYRWSKNYSGGSSSPSYSASFPNYFEYSFDSELGLYANGKYKWWYNGSNYCVVYPRSPYTSQVPISENYATQYRYRDISYVYNFYKWTDWSAWQPESISASDTRNVETRTAYRSLEGTQEDDSGKIYTQSGKLDAGLAGKQITLYVYKVDGASDYTNEFVGQSVIGADGSYSFEYKLREEPSVKTGDFTVAIGIEGTDNMMVVNTITAPKPTYTVNFYDWEGNIISTQTVVKGENAVLPENPEKEGYDFKGWDKSNINITEDMDIYSDFEKKQYTVVYIDWANQLVEVRKFEHGDVLTTPEYKEVEGYTFEGWDEITNGNIIVTQNMVVTAKYEINTYTVKFYDFDGNVVSTQEVEYGSSADAPEDLNESADGKQFAGWFNPEEYENVNHDVAIYPSYYFEETTDVPTANFESGEYSDKIELTLTSPDKNAVIFYYLNGDDSAEKIYTGPVTIDKTCSVTYYASSLGKNDSEVQTNYYCINSADKPSEWMLYSELPSEVRENLGDYTLESETGYRYKNIQKVSTLTDIANLEADGWMYSKAEYTPYTAWQDEEIKVNDELMGFEVETQEVADTSVTWYKYSHYKYTDGGTVKYSPVSVDGFDCVYEEITVETRLPIAGFTENEVSYYEYDGQQWFSQTKVNGVKTQYRSRYKVAEYYKWTSWGIDAPSSNETREYETDDVYRYANKNYHLVSIVNGFSELPIVYLLENSKTLDVSSLEVYGYDLEGLYYDDAFTEPFDMSTPITESVTLFAKYTPKTYTVIFQMKDGTELDTQTVEYMQPATPPATDVVPGYVFGGWDKDFDCITEDTVITGKYFKESEYARVSLNTEALYLYSGTTAQLTAKITPENLTDEVVEWSSSDNSVAMVDNNGKVMAVSQGTATITATVVKTKEQAVCTVYVTQDLTTGILLKSESSLNYDELGYLRRVEFETTVEELNREFANTNLRYFNMNGKELATTANVGTGTEVRLYKGDEIVDKKTLVITGDMTGDGIINNRDVALINRTLVTDTEMKECQSLALDVNGDGYVNNRDIAMVARYIVGKQNF